jgi:hypothetical protein
MTTTHETDSGSTSNDHIDHPARTTTTGHRW